MSYGPASSARDGDARLGGGASIDDLLDQAVEAINRGDRVAATALAGQVLAVDRGNADAEDLLTAPSSGGEIRRLTILFADLVDSTVLSTRVEPQTYRMLVGRYRDLVLGSVNRFGGHIGSTKGDGLLAVFGHPTPHEDDVRRAVLAGLEITRELPRLSQQAKRRFGIDITARVGVHRGLAYLDTDQDDVYGLAANLAARVSGLAPPGAVVISDAVAPLIRNTFELEEREPAAVKGVDELIAHHRVLGERATPARAGRGPLVGRDREVARLQESWARAQAGTLTTPGVVLRGEAGIGKSRLAAAAAELAMDSGAVVLELAGSSLHTDAGLHPIRTLLEHRCGISRLTAQSERLRLLETEVTARRLDPGTVVPLLAPVLGISAEAGYEPVAAEGRKLYQVIGHAVHDYLRACLGESAGMVVAEDAHWFDTSTLEVLDSVLDGAEGRLLLVMTSAAALIGRHLDRDLLCSVVDLSDNAVDDVIDELEDALVLEPWGIHSWRFRHELLREVAAELAPPSVRRGLHAKIAEALISDAGGEPDWRLVAAHYEQAEEHGKVVSAYQRASTDARRRGALGEARSHLTHALTQVGQQAPGRARDRREMAVRLERGFLISAAEGTSSRAAEVDFERCLRLGGSDVRDDEVFATLLALAGYYFARGDLRRSGKVFESLRGGLSDGREFFRPVVEACLGILAWLRGEFAAASTQIEQATADFAAAGQRVIESVWFAPTDPMTLAHGVLALDRFARGDLSGAQSQLAQAARRADELSFPQGPFSLAFVRFFEIWIRIEARQLDRAAALATDLIEHAERHGFEVWALWGAAQRATANALGSISAHGSDPDGLSADVSRVTTVVEAVRAAELTIYITWFDGALGELLTAAGERDQARAQLDTALALARDTGMRFYDAELFRLRAHTYTEPEGRRVGVCAALELARRQGATLFELRAAIDDFALRGEPARAALIDAASRMPATGTWPELVRAQALLR